MRSLFCVCCKLLGVYLILRTIHTLFMVISFWIGSSGIMDQLLILFIFTLVPLLCAYVCLFKTKWIADTLRVPDGGVPYLSGAGVFYAGLMLLGAGLIILSVGPIIDGIINLVERWLAGGVPALSHPHFWLVTLNPAWQAGIHLGLAFYIIKYPFKIMEWVNVESAPASDSAQDGMAS